MTEEVKEDVVVKEKTSYNRKNDFRFVLYQGKDKIMERSFTADVFNPIIRYSVDVRDSIPSIIQTLQNVMSRRNLTYSDFGYKYLDEYVDITNFYGVDDKLSKPEYVKYSYGNKTIRGVECKFGLYINSNPIVERKFYVDNYNPACRFSTEILETVIDITNEIHDSLKVLDVDHMWNDYVLINAYGLYVNQIRELSKARRKEMIDNQHDRTYIKKAKSYYWNQSQQYTGSKKD